MESYNPTYIGNEDNLSNVGNVGNEEDPLLLENEDPKIAACSYEQKTSW